MATKQDLKILEANLLSANQVLEYKIIIKLGGLLVLGFIAIATLIRFWLLR